MALQVTGNPPAGMLFDVRFGTIYRTPEAAGVTPGMSPAEAANFEGTACRCPPRSPNALAKRRPLYPEVIAFGAPRGLRARLQAMARQEGTSVSAVARRAIERELAEQKEPSDRQSKQ